MRWTEDDYQALLTRCKAGRSRSCKLERDLTSKSKRAPEDKKRKKDESKGSYKIIATQKKFRNADTDNVCPKYEIDELVRAGYLPDDSSKYVVSTETRIEFVETEGEEETIIEIWKED